MRALLPLLLLVGAAQAGEVIPRYDPEAYCDRIASISGARSETLFAGCLDLEQQAYDGLKPTWAKLPANIRGYCDRIGRVSKPSGSYSILEGCVRMELDALEKKAGKKFQF